jgi:hypothetical protein
MTDNETHQAQLLDAYLDTLMQDAEAVPPEALDPDTAAFARQIVARQSADLPTPRWEEALFQARVGMNGRTHRLSSQSHMENHPMTTYTPGRTTPSVALPLTLAASVVALLAFGLLLTTNSFGNGRNPIPAAGSLLYQDSTDTPVPEVTPTPVPPMTPSVATGGGGFAMPSIIDSDSIIMEDFVGVEGIALPAIDIVLQEIPPVDVELGEIYITDLDPDIPFATFSYNAPEDIIFLSVVETGGFPSVHQLSIQSAPNVSLFGGGGGGGGGGGPLNGPLMFMLNEGDDLEFIIGSAVGVGPGNMPNYSISFVEGEPQAIQSGETVTGAITEEQPFALYSLPTEAGTTYSVSVDGADGFDTSLQLQSRVRGLFGFDEDGGPGVNPEIYRKTATTDDEALLLVYPHFEGDTGEFSIAIEAEPAPSITDQAQVVRVGGKEFSPVVRAEGEPGTVGTVSIRPLDGEASLKLSVSDGQQEIASSSSENASQVSRDFTFPESGEVTITISGNDHFGLFHTMTEVVEVSLAE